MTSLLARPGLPPPVDFGLPDQFTSWRPGQEDAILSALETDKRFVGLVLPTGLGKSLVYRAVGKLSGARALNLTATKALQQQLYWDFREDGDTRLIQGQSMYVCQALAAGGELVKDYSTFAPGGRMVMVDHGPCHLGVECSLKAGGCTYYDALRAAMRAESVIGNYAFWLSMHHRPDVRFMLDLLVLDEAHAAPDQLAQALGADLGRRDVYEILNDKLPEATTRTAAEWVSWAGQRAGMLTIDLLEMPSRPRDAAIRKRRAQWLLRSLERIARMSPPLVLTSDLPDGVRFDLVWAAPYAEEHLFRGVKKIILTSATLTRHTADLLGIAPNDLALLDGGDGFPVARRPVYVVETVRVDHRMSVEAERLWLTRIDQILRDRADRKGIIHTVSYRRRDLILARSDYRERMMTHGRTDTIDQIAKFKRAPAGTILVSPSVTTGYDFPYRECEYQIICKVPFPDTRDPVTKARHLIDREYTNYVALQDLVQAVGRGMRADDDRCETLVIDDHARWLLNQAHAHLMPRWFRRAVQFVRTVPAPPVPLP